MKHPTPPKKKNKKPHKPSLKNPPHTHTLTPQRVSDRKNNHTLYQNKHERKKLFIKGGTTPAYQKLEIAGKKNKTDKAQGHYWIRDSNYFWVMITRICSPMWDSPPRHTVLACQKEITIFTSLIGEDGEGQKDTASRSWEALKCLHRNTIQHKDCF